jgi:hypothetical protein
VKSDEGSEPAISTLNGKKWRPALRVCEWFFAPSRKDHSWLQTTYVCCDELSDSLWEALKQDRE